MGCLYEERTVSATQTDSARSLRRVETSEASSQTAGGRKEEVILVINQVQDGDEMRDWRAFKQGRPLADAKLFF